MRNVLLLVDFQEGFLGAQTEHLRAPMQKLVKDEFFSLVIATRFRNVNTGFWSSVLGWSGLQTVEEQQLAVDLPKQSKIIDKSTYGIRSHDLNRIMPILRRSQIFMAGVESDVCVAVIAAGLFDAGVVPVVLSDYTGTNRGPEHQTHALITLRRIIGTANVVPDVEHWAKPKTVSSGFRNQRTKGSKRS